MTRTTLLILGLVATGATLAPEARAQGGRTLSVGGTTVVLARSAGTYQSAPVPRAPRVPQFRPLSIETRTAIMRAGTETLVAAAPDPALTRLAQLPGGVTLVTARPTRVLAAELPRAAAAPAFKPLSAAAKAGILQAVTAADAGAAPAAPAAETPFTLSPFNLNVVGRANLYVDNPEFLGGGFSFFSFNNGKGYVKVVNAGSTAKQFLLHFQVFNPSGASYDYTIFAGDGTTTKVSAKPLGVQDIVLMLSLPGNTGYGTLADVRGGTVQWYFIGVEITPM